VQNSDRASKGIAEFRNSLVHPYRIIKDDDLFDPCSANINDFSAFIPVYVGMAARAA
jgi:hypothetical protein